MKIKDILIQIFLILWQLPQCLVGLVMLPFLGKLRLVRYANYCWAFEAENMSGAISLGCLIFLSKYSAKKETTILHELGHVKQSHILGPIYLFIIGIPSILWAAFGDNDKCYYSFYTEKGANQAMGLEVKYGEYDCTLYIPEKKKEE
jgi:hypothetical protein